MSSHTADPLYKGLKQPFKSPSPQTTSNGFDPRRLLDPKGYNRSSRLEAKRMSSGEQPSSHVHGNLPQGQDKVDSFLEVEFDTSKDDDDDNEESGMSRLIEKAYNVGHREEPPQKRQKIDKIETFEEDHDKPKFQGGGRGGELGAYVTQKRQEGLEDPSIAPSTVVDLTQGFYLAVWALQV